ncbi:MAG: divergent polysaccharide deacetylase family protein [Candidatus Omnitrophota bacterium]
MTRRKILFFSALTFSLVFVVYDIFLRGSEPLKIGTVEEQTRSAPLRRAALVLDDFGYNKRNLAALKELDVPITLAVLPHTPYAKDICAFADENGFEVILHLPMQPEGAGAPVEKNTINADMDEAAVRKTIADALMSVPNAKGVSSHMGSKATKDARLMSIVFNELKNRDLFFLDSFTSGESVCREEAKLAGVTYFRRDIFIDNVQEPGDIAERLDEMEAAADTSRTMVGIGHDRVLTVRVLKESAAGMNEKGVELVFLSDELEQK